MINGEETGESLSGVSSPNPLVNDLSSPVSSRSHYSSCGESELERYCSANSVMGTPSLCGSVGTFQDRLDSDFGSLTSFRLGDDSALENFTLGDTKPQHKQLVSLHDLPDDAGDTRGSTSELPTLWDSNTALDEGLYGEDDKGGVIQWRDRANLRTIQTSFQNKVAQHKENAETIEASHFSVGVTQGSQSHMTTEQVDGCLEGLNSESVMDFDRKEDGRCSGEGENSSRCEHSEGEDSMFGYDTEEDKHIDLYHRRNIIFPDQTSGRNENTLLMTSSIAFGSDDWDDFMQETGGNPLVPMVRDEIHEQKQQNMESEANHLKSALASPTSVPEKQEDASTTPLGSNQGQVADELAVSTKTGSKNSTNHLKVGEAEQVEKVKDMLVTTNQAEGAIEPAEYLQTCTVTNVFETGQEEAPLKEVLNISDSGLKQEHQYTSTEEATGIDDSRVSESIESDKTQLQLDPLSDITVSHRCSASVEATEDQWMEVLKNHQSTSLQSSDDNNMKLTVKESPVSFNLSEDRPTPIKTEKLELNGFYDEVVHEMEEILLDSGESPGARFTQGNRTSKSHVSLPLRDGGSTASTSGTDDAHLVIQRPLRIDGVEVVGARQKKGDVSLSERLVGVKEYTVYKIRVWSGEDSWEVERRYRDFCTLYRRLKTFFISRGWILPSPWSSVERESRKIFGNASPDVIADRSALIQECLQSILHSRLVSNLPSALSWFLSPSKAVPSPPALDTRMPSSFSTRGAETESVATLGKTISLVVETQPYKPTKQMLEAQHNTCAGCHRHFDDGKTRMWDLVQTLGWGKPRLCKYSGQLFCSLCHTNETAVLPARVLHFWDFTQYPVSQFAKSYLDSIQDQPMLCVSAVNPFLFSKVPALQHVTNVRKKIGAMLPFVRCPFRRAIYKGLGSRRYLLESNDFFALRDLIDLSKGVFAALPVMVETVSRKILEHIMEQCLICCDAGVPCDARQACDDPSSLIFPFQEGEVERCRSCELVFHKVCFKKLSSCPCGAQLKLYESKGGVDSEEDGTLDLLGTKTDSRSPVRFLSGLFSKAMPEKLLGSRNSDTVILMGSLPSTSL